MLRHMSGIAYCRLTSPSTVRPPLIIRPFYDPSNAPPGSQAGDKEFYPEAA